MNKRPLQIDGETYYFTITFWGDSITPMYKVKMYYFGKKKFLFWSYNGYRLLAVEDYHRSEFNSFETICKRTYEKLVKEFKMINDFNNLS